MRRELAADETLAQRYGALYALMRAAAATPAQAPAAEPAHPFLQACAAPQRTSCVCKTHAVPVMKPQSNIINT